jgi:hypothetical protein
MHLRFLAIVFPLVLLRPAASADTIIPSTTYGTGQAPVVVVNFQTITTNANAVTVSAGATVIYQSATSVKLEPGFHAASGAHFYATIGTAAGADTDGDGIPDVWERANGLNPNDSTDAQHVTSSGLIYLQEYQLGTNPAKSKQSDTSNSAQLKINRPTL